MKPAESFSVLSYQRLFPVQFGTLYLHHYCELKSTLDISSLSDTECWCCSYYCCYCCCCCCCCWWWWWWWWWWWRCLIADCAAEVRRQMSQLSGARCQSATACLSPQGTVWGVLYEDERMSDMSGSNHHPAVTLVCIEYIDELQLLTSDTHWLSAVLVQGCSRGLPWCYTVDNTWQHHHVTVNITPLTVCVVTLHLPLRDWYF